MKTYHPMAVTDNGTLFVHDGMNTVSDALKQFDIWESDYGYRISEAWIDVYESGKEIKKLSVAHKWVIESEDAYLIGGREQCQS